MASEIRTDSEHTLTATSNEKTGQAEISFETRFIHYYRATIRVDPFVEVLLLILTFITGIQDAVSYPDFHCFASNQTGNTVLLAVGIAGFNRDLFHLRLIVISLSLFLVGAIITGQIANYVGRRQRGFLFLIHLFQTIAVFGAAHIQFTKGTDAESSWALGALALLAVSAGAQVTSMRPLKLPEITTAMATAAWVDLMSDLKIWRKHNRPRDRRVMFLMSLVTGGLAGAWMNVRIGSPLAIVVSGIGKVLVVIGILFCREDRAAVATNA